MELLNSEPPRPRPLPIVNVTKGPDQLLYQVALQRACPDFCTNLL
jgi:hypothetical protein